MKKFDKRLALNRQTVRVISSTELERAAGGLDSDPEHSSILTAAKKAENRAE